MPLDAYFPKIDDRTYDDIMDEVRTRIARYTPEWKPTWTDLNDNDPGITLTQVFAWLSEMLLYRMNRVPALNYYKFLQLLGIELNAAEPASAEITFPVKKTHTQPYVIVPLRTQISAEDPEGGELTYRVDGWKSDNPRKNVFQATEDAIYGKTFDDPVVGYQQYIDVPSFIDYFIIS